jgi:hypothetical protein
VKNHFFQFDFEIKKIRENKIASYCLRIEREENPEPKIDLTLP